MSPVAGAREGREECLPLARSPRSTSCHLALVRCGRAGIYPRSTPLPGPDGPATLANLTAAGGHLYFTADDGVHGNEVWTSDGTAAGTQMLLDINPTSGGPFGPGGHNGSQASQFTAAGGLVYFTADD